MHFREGEVFPAAAFRMIDARMHAWATGVYAWRPGAFRFCAGSTVLEAAVAAGPGRRGVWRPAPAKLDRAVEAGTVTRIRPGEVGLDAAFAALVPVAGADGAPIGFLLALDTRARQLTPAVKAALRDGAELARPRLLAASEGRHPTPAWAHNWSGGGLPPQAVVERLVEAARTSRAGPFALMILDLDRFRSINEALGTAAGDALLAVTGARLENALGPGDRLVHLEGDSYVILAARAGGGLRTFAQRLLRVVGQPIELGSRTVAMQASIGIVAGLRDDLPTATLLRRAETALRCAKAEGRNRFVLHEPGLEAATLEKSRLELDLANAPANGQMQLAYQPYIDLATDAVSGAEALLRWRHPLRGELPPAAFIPLAEATGLILPLGNWALRAAMIEAARWPVRMALSVNISALQFHQPDFTQQVDAALAATGFPAARLELEITETVLMRDNPATTHQLRTLIARGVRIALDDFGTGYSALAYLARLPHHRIKLDKAFVQDLSNPATAELIRAIIALARSQGIAVTAEGVERPDLLAEVRRMGFTHAQGYATGMPAADTAPLMVEAV